MVTPAVAFLCLLYTSFCSCHFTVAASLVKIEHMQLALVSSASCDLNQEGAGPDISLRGELV